MVRTLLAKARPAEVKYIVKIMTGDLRIGLRESLVEEAIAKAYERPIAAVRRANMLLGDIGETLQCAFRNELETVRFRLFHPIDFMLATPVENAAEIFKNAVEPMVVEEKYDGIRAQAHKSGGPREDFLADARRSRRISRIGASRLASLAGEFIVDGEILAWHDSQPLPFTQLQKRLGRRNPDLCLMEEIPVKFVMFDLLYLDGELLLDLPLIERRTPAETTSRQRRNRNSFNSRQNECARRARRSTKLFAMPWLRDTKESWPRRRIRFTRRDAGAAFGSS